MEQVQLIRVFTVTRRKRILVARRVPIRWNISPEHSGNWVRMTCQHGRGEMWITEDVLYRSWRKTFIHFLFGVKLTFNITRVSFYQTQLEYDLNKLFRVHLINQLSSKTTQQIESFCELSIQYLHYFVTRQYIKVY